MNDLLDRIYSRGWWHVIVRPTIFMDLRVSEIRALLPILQRCVVSPHGWDFPHIDPRKAVRVDDDWIGQETDWQQYLEVWRFYQSGQFVHVSGFGTDWRDRSSLQPANEGRKPCTEMPVINTLDRLTKIFEFAARLALTDAGDARMHIEVRLERLNGRVLYEEQRRGSPLFSTGSNKAQGAKFTFSQDCDRAELAADARLIAVKAAGDLFYRFGWDAPPELLKSWQAELFGKVAQPPPR